MEQLWEGFKKHIIEKFQQKVPFLKDVPFYLLVIVVICVTLLGRIVSVVFDNGIDSSRAIQKGIIIVCLSVVIILTIWSIVIKSEKLKKRIRIVAVLIFIITMAYMLYAFIVTAKIPEEENVDLNYRDTDMSIGIQDDVSGGETETADDTNADDDLMNPQDPYEFIDSFVTPLFQSDELELSSARRFYDSFKDSSIETACTLNTYLRNNTDEAILVAENNLVIDSIEELDEPRLFVVATYDYANSLLSVYALNNERATIYDVDITLKLTISEGYPYPEQIDLSQINIENFIDGSPKLHIEKLIGGEIQRLGKYKIDTSKAHEWENFLLCYESSKVTYGYKSLLRFEVSNGNLYVIGSQGGAAEIHKEEIFIDTALDDGTTIELENNIYINENEYKAILYSIYPDASCNIKMHSSVRIAGENQFIDSNVVEARIWVPIYKEEGYFFVSLKNYLQSYDVDTYYLGTDPQLEASFINQNNKQAIELQNSFSAADDEINASGIETPELGLDYEYSYDDILNEYKKLAESNFNYEVLKQCKYVNSGVSSIVGKENYAVYYQLRDLNGDSVQELIISVCEVSTINIVADLFTMQDGVPKRLVQDGTLVGGAYGYTICTDNRIRYQHMEAENCLTVEFFSISIDDASLIRDETYYCFTDDCAIFMDSEGNSSDITVEEFRQNVFGRSDGIDIKYDGFSKWEKLYVERSVHYDDLSITPVVICGNSYDDVLNEYIELAQNNFSAEVLERCIYVNQGVSSISGEEKYCLYYLLRDLNNDGVQELLISVGEPEYLRSVTDLFTMQNGMPIRIIDNDIPCYGSPNYDLLEDNRIRRGIYDNSDGGFIHEIEYYRLLRDGSELILEEKYTWFGEYFVYTDGEGKSTEKAATTELEFLENAYFIAIDVNNSPWTLLY